jgi:hypothetical protein
VQRRPREDEHQERAGTGGHATERPRREAEDGKGGQGEQCGRPRPPAVPGQRRDHRGQGQVGRGDDQQVAGPAGVVGDADESQQPGEREQGRDLQSCGARPATEQASLRA